MKNLENDFVDKNVVDLNIAGYEKGAFMYRPTTAGEESEWLNDYMKIVDGKAVQDFSKLNRLKMENLMFVPYPKELIGKITGIEKEWKELNNDMRWKVLSNLKGRVFDLILGAMKEIDDGTEPGEKKSAGQKDKDV